MNERQNEILRIALMYMAENMRAAREGQAPRSLKAMFPNKGAGCITFNGEGIHAPTFNEIDQLMKEIQD